MTKIISAFIILFLALFILPKSVSAQCELGTGRNCFSCEWTGIECDVDWTYTAYPPYGCVPGFEVNPALCQGLDFSACQTTSNLDCVETSPGSCYECVDTITGCIPRDPGDPRCEYSDADSCASACSGSEPTRFRCDGGECVEDGSGPYEGLGECALNCDNGGLSPALINCSGGAKGIDTAIGCIPLEDTNAFAGFFIGWGIRIAGGVAFLLIVFSGFQITTSGGDPKKLQAGRELLTAAIAGLLLLIFSVFLLRLVGVNILGLPSFGS